MELKWFTQIMATGKRHRLYKRNTKLGAWAETPYFIDSANHKSHYTYNKKHGLYGSGLGELATLAKEPYRIAACFGGFGKLSEAKFQAKKLLLTPAS